MKKKLEKIQKKIKNPVGRPSKVKILIGRPSNYTKELGDRLCALIASTSLGLRSIIELEKDFPGESTIRSWRLHEPEFSAQYARAKLCQADILAEDCLQIADDSTIENVNVARLRIDTRKFLASKLLPKQYGDRGLLDQTVEENENLKNELRQLRDKLDEISKRDF